MRIITFVFHVAAKGIQGVCVGTRRFGFNLWPACRCTAERETYYHVDKQSLFRDGVLKIGEF